MNSILFLLNMTKWETCFHVVCLSKDPVHNKKKTFFFFCVKILKGVTVLYIIILFYFFISVQ